jgi:hypothetical protein
VSEVSAGIAGASAVRLEWVAWPLRDRPTMGVIAFLVVLVSSVLAAVVGGHSMFGVIAGVILLGSLNPFFSPTTFRLRDDEVEAVRGPVRKIRRWQDVRSCFVDRHGATLSPFVGRAWLEPYRGLRLLFAGNRDEVVTFLRTKLGEEVEVVEALEVSSRGRAGGDI